MTFQDHTTLPLIVKGVQCLEDVQLCVDHGVEGVIIVSCRHVLSPRSAAQVAPKLTDC
jgi:isopentenyl diphosphate isomerase/L-lactate dehydrogenase-like FMN-dependent dehydrogenase